uniref:Sulfatase modifying factor 2 n=1 Tax=Anas platyrhynchos platyrhynchos TaxID=8840 RepID=A0A493TFE8_ANAPP
MLCCRVHPYLQVNVLVLNYFTLLAYGKDENMVQLPGGTFQMGSNSPENRNEEGPVREVTVKPFAIDKYPVTNRDFREFVREKKFKTEAEAFGWSFVFEDFVSEEMKKKVTQKLEKGCIPGETSFSQTVQTSALLMAFNLNAAYV